MKTRILILYTSVGYGIKVTAENIFERLEKDGRFEVRKEDIGNVESGWFGRFWAKIYSLLLNKFSAVWGFLYDSDVINFIALPLRKPLASFNSKRVLKLLREYQPAVVISTQAAPTGVVAYLKSKGLYQGKLIAAFSDYHLHPFWCFREVDLYFCNIEQQVGQLKKLGYGEDKYVVTGTLAALRFFQEIPKEQAKMKFGLLSSLPVVILTSGARVREETKELFTKLLRSGEAFQIVVVCGKNEVLKKELEAISAPDRHPIKILGFIDNMEVLMSAGDVLVGKTGGPTMSEAVIKKLPMVLTDVRPGHEMKNLEYLVRQQIVEYARIPREVVFLVEEILKGKIKKDFSHSFETIVRPKSAVNIADAVDKLAPEKIREIAIHQYDENA
jgi:processive 1,2-diacylglycerol beta-glucosyltransferase